ncbi:Cyp4ac2 [Drosophila busckii]|uniref:Cyp4ac2 n=1 Tax=Drosophila busckii TaxID=30019 RepID=A0A0M4EQL7_DROBS|nr:Cyp4ac2 [Drosophila busckii]
MLYTLLITGVLLFLVWLLLRHLDKSYFLLAGAKRIQTIDGSPLESKVAVLPGNSIFGNNLDVLNMTPSRLFRFTRDAYAKSKGRNYVWYFLWAPMLNVTRAEDVEEIFQSTKLITKNVVYELLKPFLGEGLLISTDQKWHFRRKLLTPAFHFNVLQNFLEIFKEESLKLVQRLEQSLHIDLPLSHVIPQFTLNNVCETALGIKLDDMAEGDKYREAIHALESVMVERVCNPLLYFQPYFYFKGSYEKHVKHLKIAHDFSSHIIERKRQQFKAGAPAVDECGRKQRYAMLDTLLAAEAAGQIDHQGICDEVNTFMFEGYDTTSTCLTFTLLMLALHGNVQQRCVQELHESLAAADMELSVFDYNQLEYLECVIKESLRLFPPVPFLGRQCTEQSIVNGLILPKNAQINIHVFDIMRDPRHFPNPSSFEPERFLPQNTVERHPFAFVPFSAGQRNCIGQKFAILEMKVLLVAVLRNFKLLPVTRLEDIIMEYGIVLRSQQSVQLRLERRV